MLALLMSHSIATPRLVLIMGRSHPFIPLKRAFLVNPFATPQKPELPFSSVRSVLHDSCRFQLLGFFSQYVLDLETCS